MAAFLSSPLLSETGAAPAPGCSEGLFPGHFGMHPKASSPPDTWMGPAQIRQVWLQAAAQAGDERGAAENSRAERCSLPWNSLRLRGVFALHDIPARHSRKSSLFPGNSHRKPGFIVEPSEAFLNPTDFRVVTGSQ